jgi:hypothetical protein
LVGYVSQIAGFLADLAPLLLIALNSIFIFLYSEQFRWSDSHDAPEQPRSWSRFLKHSVPFIVVAVLLAVIPPPWSQDYAIVGIESCFIYENGTAVTSFVPRGGARVIKAINRQPPLELVQDWQGYMLPRGPALVISESFNDSWRLKPKLKRTSNNVTFKSDWIPVGAKSVTLVVKCRKEKCVQAFGEFTQIGYRETEFGEFTAVFRVSPVDQNLSLTFQITEEMVPVDVLYTSNERTPGLSRLRKIMGWNVRRYAKEEFFSDTVRIFQREV